MTLPLLLAGCALVVALLALGVPIYLVLTASAASFLLLGGGSVAGIGQHVLDQLNSPALVSLPFFLLAAVLMRGGGVAKALFDAAVTWIGWLPGGLALAGIAATALFAAINGSSVATALAMGSLLVPMMIERGYRPGFAMGLTAAAATLGILIPPSLPLDPDRPDRRDLDSAAVSGGDRAANASGQPVRGLCGGDGGPGRRRADADGPGLGALARQPARSAGDGHSAGHSRRALRRLRHPYGIGGSGGGGGASGGGAVLWPGTAARDRRLFRRGNRPHRRDRGHRHRRLAALGLDHPLGSAAGSGAAGDRKRARSPGSSCW